MNENLERLGNELEAAVREQLAPRRRMRKRLAVAAVALAVAVPSVALAAAHFSSTEDVAKSLPAGTLSLAGTEPTCTTVSDGVEYHCTLARPPAPEVSDWKGTVEPTVDATKHVNGGCRGLNSAGTEWECYIGQTAVDQQIIGQGFLGQFAPSPGVG
ncbi:MAG: hypothetical protein WAU41_13385 [Gaiellaceae bacterium]